MLNKNISIYYKQKMSNTIKSGTNILTDNWNLQVIANFLTQKVDPSTDFGWIAANDKGVFEGTIRSGAFQIDSLISLLEQILFTNNIYLMKEWVSTWYGHGTDLNKLYNHKGSGIIKDISREDIDFYNEKDLWLKNLLPNKKIQERFDRGMEAFMNGKNDFWSQIINGIAEYLSFSSIKNLTYSPHPARSGFLKSTLWSISTGMDYPTAGINRFNQIIDKKRISLSKTVGQNKILSQLNTQIPSAALLCLAESSDACSPITVALQMRENDEIKNLRTILHNLTIAIGKTDFGNSPEEVEFYVSRFNQSVNEAERRLIIPKSLGGNNSAGYIGLEYYDYEEFKGSLVVDKSQISNHSGIVTKLINTGSIHTRKLLEHKLKIKDPIVYTQLANWYNGNFFNSLDNIKNINLYKITMEENNYINNGNAGILGPDGKIINSSIEQNTVTQVSNFDLNELSKELEKLLEELKKKSNLPEHFTECAKISEAHQEAIKGDRKKVIEALKKTGQWVFNTSTQIGIGLTSAILKEVMIK